MQQSFSFTTASPSPSRRNLVIEAGAGTGKTTAIVAEVLKLMLDREDLAPERIVLVTFTEKAAGEIADRIRAALEELANGDALQWPAGSPHPLVRIDDRERARRAIAHHLENIDALRSQTIHSFCQSLLRAFPIEAGLDPQFKIIEGFERSALYGQVYDAWVDEETRVSPREEIVREWELLFAHAGYLFMIRDLVLTLINRRDLLGETEYDFGDFEKEVRDDLLFVLGKVRSCADDNGDENARRIFAYIRETPMPELLTIDECIDYFAPIAASIRDANLPKSAVLKDALKVLRAADTKGRSIHERLVSHRAAMALLALTRRFMAFLDEEKRKLGVVDFDDLLLRTLALLDDPAVLARARGQFDYIFVDEFQDTDRTQARIIDKLARDASGAYVPGRTIVVGDPKQSIYGFRRADPETYYRMTEQLVAANGEARRLGEQYRSDAPLLEVVNAMFERLFPERQHDPNVFTPSYRALQAARPAPRRTLDARVTMLQAAHDEKSDRYFAEAEAIARWIQKNRDGGANDLQRFAILFRRLTKIDDYLDTLDRYGIEYVLPPTRLFLDRRAPVDLLAVLRAIAYPFDKGAQISAARTPYFALTDDEILECGGKAAALESGGFAAALQGYRRPDLTVSQLIDLLLETTKIEDVYAAMVDGERHLRHLEHVRRIAFDYDQRHGGSVRQFVDEIARRRADPEEMEPSLADETQNAVRILSVHAAKGLEFDTVILPDLSFPAGGGDALQLFTVEEPRSLVMAGRADSISANFRFASGEKLKKIAGRREDAEMRRLFYVAVTRAKTDVVFVCNLTDDTKNAGFLKCLLEILGTDKATLAAMWPATGREVRATDIGPLAFETMECGGKAAALQSHLADAALEQTLATGDILPLAIVSPEDPPPSLTPGEVAAKRSGSRNRAAGTLLHKLLELWDGVSDPDPLLRELTAGVDEATIERTRRRLAVIRKSPALARIARAETIGRELPIHVVENGAVVERRIDRLVREPDRELVIDYKSGPADPARIEKDRAQVSRYCDAVRAMTGRECGGVVWYVDEDVTVEVNQKPETRNQN